MNLYVKKKREKIHFLDIFFIFLESYPYSLLRI